MGVASLRGGATTKQSHTNEKLVITTGDGFVASGFDTVEKRTRPTQPAAPLAMTYYSAFKYSFIKANAMAPSPTAEATR
jgi:hypothetical protein